MMALPETFLSETRRLLGDETADCLFRALETDAPSVAVRLNPLKPRGHGRRKRRDKCLGAKRDDSCLNVRVSPLTRCSTPVATMSKKPLPCLWSRHIGR